MSAPTKVMLNALYLAPGVSGGPETYLRGLAPALAQEFGELELVVATTRSGAAALRADGWADWARVLAFPCEDGQRARRQWSEQILLPLAARRERVEIVHSLANLAPVYAGAAAVVTIHDVTFLSTPTFGRVTTWGMSLLVRLAARRADALITGSAAAASWKSARCSVSTRLTSPSCITVTRPHARRYPTAAGELRERYGLDGSRVVLCVAAKRPHKNQELLVPRGGALPADTTIVLAGHAEPYEQTLRRLARGAGPRPTSRFVGYVSDADLEGLWDIASCAALPTLSEGFGIPALEALAHGVPIACSRLPVLEEVAGEIAHYFDPRDPEQAAGAIKAALADTDASRLGPARAARFTWATAARGTYAAYERALARRAP